MHSIEPPDLTQNNHILTLILLGLLIYSCTPEIEDSIIPDEEDVIIDSVYTIPVVIHVIHSGEEIGTGYNISNERIVDQIKTLNDDFRKKAGTLGYNTHPLGTDVKIAFKLAEISPEGEPTDGINRVNAHDVVYEPNSDDWLFDNLPYYGYWDIEQYINIWVFPFEPNFIIGQASLPKVNLPGLEDSDITSTSGIMITTPHFGASDIEGPANLGKSLTHEMGHFLGLHHLWGEKENEDCMEFDDYCDDTPYVSSRTNNCDDILTSCNGEELITQNYMDYTDDACMNMFTKDQVKRMRYVLENSDYRKTLITSPAISRD